MAPALSAGMDGELGIDNHFKDEAEKVGKAIAGIETQRFQFDLMSTFPDDLQVKWLAGALGVKVDASEFNRRMISERNVHMADVAEQYLKAGGQTFMVVGSGHVGGDDGVIRLLEKRGHEAVKVPLRR